MKLLLFILAMINIDIYWVNILSSVPIRKILTTNRM